MEGIEEISCQMISEIGKARSCYVKACGKVKNKEFEEADKCMEEGNQYYLRGHQVHAKIIQQEAAGNQTAFSLLLLHAEDLMSSTENFKIMAEEVITIYQIMHHNHLDMVLTKG